jgi:hypothetical protein
LKTRSPKRGFPFFGNEVRQHELDSRTGTSPVRRGFSLRTRMLWIEAIINISAFAGFIGLANRYPKDEQVD